MLSAINFTFYSALTTVSVKSQEELFIFPLLSREHPTFLINTLLGYCYTNIACLRRLRIYNPRLIAIVITQIFLMVKVWRCAAIILKKYVIGETVSNITDIYIYLSQLI